MKYIIDLIEDVREEVGSHDGYVVTVGLLKEDVDDSTKLVYAGEALLNKAVLDDENRRLTFGLDGSDKYVSLEALMPPLLILEMDVMMYPLSVDVNAQHKDIEVIGFGKSDEEQRYTLFIKI